MLAVITGCTPKPKDVRNVAEMPHIIPDYIFVIIPPNIAPMNFQMKKDVEALSVTIKSTAGKTLLSMNTRGKEVKFNQNQWKKLMDSSVGQRISISVTALIKGQWYHYSDFQWMISTDRIKSFLSYRYTKDVMNEPNKTQTIERNLENFSERIVSDSLANSSSTIQSTDSTAGKWIIFSYKQRDGKRNHLYLSYLDKFGKAHKPYLLPQKNPDFYSTPASLDNPELTSYPHNSLK